MYKLNYGKETGKYDTLKKITQIYSNKYTECLGCSLETLYLPNRRSQTHFSSYEIFQKMQAYTFYYFQILKLNSLKIKEQSPLFSKVIFSISLHRVLV